MSGIFDQVINYAPPSLLLGTVTYKGTWSAATNTPTLPNPPSSITNGNYYVVSAAGTQFSLSFNIGDWIISNGSAWEKVDNTDAVSSVFGRTGAVVGVSTDYSSVGITATAVGASSPSTGAFTTLSATTPLAVASGGTGVASSTGTTNVVLSGSPTITTPVIAQINDANGNETLKLASIASAVNEVTIENAATGNAVHISATGGDASVGLHLAGKGASGYVNVQDSVDATKRIMFNASGGTTNTRTMLSSTQTVDRTLSLPDATDTLVGKATTDTLTNKTLTSPTITGGALNGTLGATTPSSVAATTGTFSSTLGVTGVATLGNGAILGTPASGTVTNLTGTASININGTVGATTRNTVAATTLDASRGSSGTVLNLLSGNSANYVDISIGRTAQEWFLGLSAAANNYATGTVAGDLVFGASGAANLFFGINNSVVGKFTSTGLNSTAIGATTPSTVSATTGTFSSTVSGTTITASTGFRSAGGLNISGAPINGTTGINLELGDASSTMLFRSFNRTTSAYAPINIHSSTLIFNADGGAASATFTSTGLNSTAIGATTPSTGAFTTLTSNNHVSTTNATYTLGTSSNKWLTAFIQTISDGATAAGALLDTTGTTVLHGKGTDWTIQRFYSSGNEIANISSTGAAITGTLSASSSLTVAGSGTIDSNIYSKSDGTTYGSWIGSGYVMAAQVGGAIALLNRNGSDGGIVNFYRSGTTVGTISVTTTATAYNTSSDYRLKNVDGPVVDSGTFIDALKPKVGTWKTGGSKFVGFIAHEFAEVSPSSVVGEKDAVDADGKAVYQSMQASSSEVIANLVAELQSLRKRLAALESK